MTLQLKWKAHIEYLQVKCLKRLDIMTLLASPIWGASSKILRTFYISYICAKLDYGAVIYCTFAKSNLEKLEKVQNAAIRLILGARKSTPILSLQAEAYIPPLDMHRGYLSVKKLIKLSYKAEGMSILDPVTSNRFCDTDYPVNSFMRRALFWSKMYEVNIKRVYENDLLNMPMWETNLKVIMCYDEGQIYNNQIFLEYLNDEYTGFKFCYTDRSNGSGTDIAVGSAMYFSDTKFGCAYREHPDHSVIYSELFAIRKSLYIEVAIH